MIDPLDLPLMRTLRFYPRELDQYDREREQPKYEPTPEQIAAAKAEIRATWTTSMERSRRGDVHQRYVEVTESIMPEGVTEREVMW